MVKVKDFKKKLVLLVVYALLVFTAHQFGITCIFLYFLGVPCPGCGITRACISALKLDFYTAFSYNIMFWSVPVLLLYFFCDGRIFKNKVIDRIILVFIAAGFFINWIYKLCLNIFI